MWNFTCITRFWYVMWVRLSPHMQNRGFRVLSFEIKNSKNWYRYHEVECKFFPRFAMKLNKYAYRSEDLPLIFFCGTKLIEIKIYTRSYWYGNIALYYNFLNFKIILRENCIVWGKSYDTIIFWRPLRSWIR